MSAVLQLSCWLVGNDTTQVFQVKIANTESVGTLKEVIKDKITLQHADPDSLRLWKDSIPVDRT